MNNNNNVKKPYVLCIDDDHDMLNLIERYLTNSDYVVGLADSGVKGLKMISETRPDLILLDAMMPELDGYEVCSLLQNGNETSYIPIIFITGMGDEQNKARAFSLGAVDYLVKPLQKDFLLQKISEQLEKKVSWKRFEAITSQKKKTPPSDFSEFKDFLFDQLNLSTNDRKRLAALQPSKVYNICSELNIKADIIAKHIATFTKLPYISHIDPSEIKLGVLPTPFCMTNKVVPLKDEGGKKVFVISNPFLLELLDSLRNLAGPDAPKIKLTEPDNIDMLGEYSAYDFTDNIFGVEDIEKIVTPVKEGIVIAETSINKRPIVYITNNMILKAVYERASDIHLEPKENSTVVRFRVDGIMKDVFSLKLETAAMVVSRLKAYADMDIAERRRPQDGSFTTTINNCRYSFRLATVLTPNGESLVIRLLKTHTVPRKLKELGMTEAQSNTLIDLGNRTRGLILLVGITGSGKTTTIYSLLHQMDCKHRSIISVEDPVEYYMPIANQEQVNEKAGITFEALLKSAVRQDPDILFVGEIRDKPSAKTCIDFASTGHLTISSLHTSNATTAIFRLDRLGIDRQTLADTVIGIVAQNLLRILCVHCKKVTKISDEEIDMLRPFTDNIPTNVAHPAGCRKCNNSGYSGREGVYEILQFDEEISEMVRSNVSIAEIRFFAQEKRDLLITSHAIEKLKKLIFTPKDVYEMILINDIILRPSKTKEFTAGATKATKKESDTKSILIIEDDEDTRKLITLLLENQGYKIDTESNGIDALISLDKNQFDLILSDINMPNLDGFKLLEIMNQKGINIPTIFLTARTTLEDEMTGLELGAVDYIKKPIQKETLLLRIRNTFEKSK